MINSIKVMSEVLNHINVYYVRNSGLPKGREPYGDGVAIVLRDRESLLQGEVQQEIFISKFMRCSDA